MPDQENQNREGQAAATGGGDHIQPREDAGSDRNDEEMQPEKSSRRKFIVIAVLIFLIVGACLFYWHSTFTEDTDDAQIDGNLYQVSSRVTGQVIKVYVDDNQQVHAGQLLAEIDPKAVTEARERVPALANAHTFSLSVNPAGAS